MPRSSQPVSNPFSQWWRSHPGLCFAVLSAVWVAFLYRHALAGGFVYDDIDQVQYNAALSSWQALVHDFVSVDHFSVAFRGFGGTFYRPLFWASLVLDRHLWGLNPAGFHLTNLALHWANGLAAFLLLRRLHARVLLAASAIFLWLGLPILSEAVAWISGRPVCLLGLLLLLSLLAAEWYRDSTRAIALFLYAAAMLAALLSHEAGVIILPLVILTGLVAERRRSSWAPLTGAGVAAFALYSALRYHADATAPLSLELLPAGAALFRYIAWMALPLHMSMERSTDTPANSLSFAAIGSLAFFLVAFGAIVWWRRRIPDVAAGFAWMGIALLPFLGIVPLYQGMAERYTYIASMGFAFTLVALAARAVSARLPVGAVLLVWVLWGAWRLDARVLDWRSEATLYSSSLTTNPRSAILLYNLGAVAERAADFEKAGDLYRQALDRNPKYAAPVAGLGNIRFDRGELAQAAALYRQAASLDPQFGGAVGGLANVHLAQGDLRQALAEYQRAVLLDPADLSLRVNLGAALQRAGDLAGAEHAYRAAIAMDPAQDRPYSNLGAALLQQGKLDEALTNLQKAVAINPRNRTAYLNMASVYRQKGDVARAAKMFLQAETNQDDRTRPFTVAPAAPSSSR